MYGGQGGLGARGSQFTVDQLWGLFLRAPTSQREGRGVEPGVVFAQ